MAEHTMAAEEAEFAEKRSYTTVGFSPLRVVRDGLRQVRAVLRIKRQAEVTCRDVIGRLQQFEGSVERNCGLRLEGLKCLEIGHGQVQLDIAYLAARGNDCTGIDMDVTPRGWTDMAGYWRVMRRNGALRAAKTFARGLTGVNRVLRREFCRQMNVRSWPTYDLREMDACSMDFPDGSFDFVYSSDVFEHLDDPQKAIAEVFRILKPGGGFWLRFLHYEHHNALHDFRVITRSVEQPPPWGHLVSSLRQQVNQGAWVNNLTVTGWRELFGRMSPGCVIELEPTLNAAALEALPRMRGRHTELSRFTDEELLAEYVIAAGRKGQGGTVAERSPEKLVD